MKRYVTKLTIPPPDIKGFWHYTYVTKLHNSKHWYGGKHTTKNLNDGYLGSGKWIKSHLTRGELIIEIVGFHDNETEAFIAEAKLVTWHIIDNDKFCRNHSPGGGGGALGGGNKLIRQQIINFDLVAHNKRIADNMAIHRAKVRDLIAKAEEKSLRAKMIRLLDGTLVQSALHI